LQLIVIAKLDADSFPLGENDHGSDVESDKASVRKHQIMEGVIIAILTALVVLQVSYPLEDLGRIWTKDSVLIKVGDGGSDDYKEP
jgi:hypothetical protein